MCVIQVFIGVESSRGRLSPKLLERHKNLLWEQAGRVWPSALIGLGVVAVIAWAAVLVWLVIEGVRAVF